MDEGRDQALQDLVTRLVLVVEACGRRVERVSRIGDDITVEIAGGDPCGRALSAAAARELADCGIRFVEEAG